MVIVNYQQYLRQKILQHIQNCSDKTLKKALQSPQFQQLMIRLYEYCQQLNIIKRRIQKLKFTTDRGQTIMPKLIDSQIKRIDNKAKEIGTAYSLFLLKQHKFKVLSNQYKYYQELLKIIVQIVVEKCFAREDSEHLTKCIKDFMQKLIDCLGRIPLIRIVVGNRIWRMRKREEGGSIARHLLILEHLEELYILRSHKQSHMLTTRHVSNL